MPYEERNSLMSDKFNELIELFIAEEEDKAKELFHQICVEKSRDIYESLLDEEEVEETDETVEEDEAVEESDMDENLSSEQAQDFIDDIDADEEGLDVAEEEDADEDMEDRVVDLEDALDELKAEFEKLMGDEEGDDEGDMDMDMDMDADMGDEEEEMESVEMEETDEVEEDSDFVREYTEKVADAKGEDHKAASPVAGKNDMGGSAKNIAQGGDEAGGSVAAPKVDDAGNKNKPGGKAGLEKA